MLHARYTLFEHSKPLLYRPTWTLWTFGDFFSILLFADRFLGDFFSLEFLNFLVFSVFVFFCLVLLELFLLGVFMLLDLIFFELFVLGIFVFFVLVFFKFLVFVILEVFEFAFLFSHSFLP